MKNKKEINTYMIRIDNIAMYVANLEGARKGNELFV